MNWIEKGIIVHEERSWFGLVFEWLEKGVAADGVANREGIIVLLFLFFLNVIDVSKKVKIK